MYRFLDRRGMVMYVGRAGNLRTRTLSYWGSLADRPHLRRMVPQIGRVEALACAGAHETAWLERNLLGRALPRWNRMRGGLELPVWLRLDSGPRHPSLQLIHGDQVAPGGFGPYLGADRARAVRSGLLRVWPLAAVGAGASPAIRDLATLRGVAGTPSELAGAIAAALTGDPARVAQWRAGLHAARDRAVAAEAFELAAQATAELTAMDWVLAPQRVTRPGGWDGSVSASCAGVQLSLEVRGGRLHRWRQSLRAPARARSGGCPADLQEFAEHNAELAARLLGHVPGPVPADAPCPIPADTAGDPQARAGLAGRVVT